MKNTGQQENTVTGSEFPLGFRGHGHSPHGHCPVWQPLATRGWHVVETWHVDPAVWKQIISLNLDFIVNS